MAIAAIDNRIGDSLLRMGEIAGDLDLPVSTIPLERALFKKDLFTILVVGEFDVGKSSLINAITGKDYLPVSQTPTTATINCLEWGKKPGFEVEDVTGQRHPFQLSRDELKEFVVGDEVPDRIRMVRVFHPDFPKSIRLVDTPGVNDASRMRTEVVYGFIPRSHAVLFVTSASEALKKTEVSFLQQRILGNDITKIFFVINQMDAIDEDEVDEFKEDLEADLERHLLKISEDFHEKGGDAIGHAVAAVARTPRIFYVSALEALEGQLTGDASRLEGSRIDHLKSAYFEFVSGRGKPATIRKRVLIRARSLAKQIGDEVRRRVELAKNREQEFDSQRSQAQQRMKALVDDLENLERDLGERLPPISDRVRGEVEQAKVEHSQMVERAFTSSNLSTLEDDLQRSIRCRVELLLESLDKEFNSLAEDLITEKAPLKPTDCGRFTVDGESNAPGDFQIDEEGLYLGQLMINFAQTAANLASPMIGLGLAALGFYTTWRAGQGSSPAPPDAEKQKEHCLDRVREVFGTLQQQFDREIVSRGTRIIESHLGRADALQTEVRVLMARPNSSLDPTDLKRLSAAVTSLEEELTELTNAATTTDN